MVNQLRVEKNKNNKNHPVERNYQSYELDQPSVWNWARWLLQYSIDYVNYGPYRNTLMMNAIELPIALCIIYTYMNMKIYEILVWNGWCHRHWHPHLDTNTNANSQYSIKRIHTLYACSLKWIKPIYTKKKTK